MIRIFSTLFVLCFIISAPARADCVSECIASTWCAASDSYADCARRSSGCYSLQCDDGGDYAFGAIAYDRKSGAWGLSNRSADEDSAEQSAMKFCTEYGDNCRVVESFSHECAAVAENEDGTLATWALHEVMADAEQAALNKCNRRAGNCSISLSTCYGL